MKRAAVLICASVFLGAATPAHQSSKTAGASSVTVTVSGPVQLIQPTAKQPPCGPGRYDSDDDLCAQWKAADAAADAALWAKLSLLLTVATIGGLLFTIRQGHLGLRRAHEANEIARREQELSWKPSLIVSMKGPYINFEELSKRQQNAGPIPVGSTITIKNEGETPATIIRFNVDVAFTDKPLFDHEASEVFYPLHPTDLCVLKRGGQIGRPDNLTDHSDWGEAYIGPHNFMDMAANPRPIVGFLDYVDQLGIIRRLNFCFKPKRGASDNFDREGGIEMNNERRIGRTELAPT